MKEALYFIIIRVEFSKKACAAMHQLLYDILVLANKALSRRAFLEKLLKALLDFSRCDCVGLFLKESNQTLKSLAHKNKHNFQFFLKINDQVVESSQMTDLSSFQVFVETLYEDMIAGRICKTSPFLTQNGSFWTSNMYAYMHTLFQKGQIKNFNRNVDFKSLALVPIPMDGQNVGFIQLQSRQALFFTSSDISYYERFAQTLGIVLANQKAHTILRERVKELTCLYNVSKIAENSGHLSTANILNQIVCLLPSAMQYPDKAFAIVKIDNELYACDRHLAGSFPGLSADIKIMGKSRGTVSIGYYETSLNNMPNAFLVEEENLLNAVAEHIAGLIERRELQHKLCQTDVSAYSGLTSNIPLNMP